MLNANLLVDYIITEEFGGTFHRLNLRTTSIIDLAFTTPFKTITWGNWHYKENTGSDHEVIGFKGLVNSIRSTSTGSLLPSYNLKKANWDLFASEL